MRGGYKMLSKNNFNEKLRQMDNQKDHFAIRKLTIGVASVLIGITFMGFGGQAVHAAEVTNTQPAVEQVSKETTTDSTQQNNDAQKDVATAQKTEVATDSQANNQIDNTKESAQLVKPITEADVKATTESQKAEIADKTNEVKPSDTQVQEKQKEQTSEVKTPDTTSNKDEQKSDQTQRLVVDKKDTENTQAARDIAAEKMQNNVQPQAKIQALIARRAESESQFNVDDWDGSLNNTTREYTLNSYHGTDKENIYIPNTQDFIDAGRISSDDKVYITKKLMHSITINGAVNVTVDDQGEKNKVYAKGDWNHAFSAYRTNLKHVNLSHVDTSGVTNMNSLFLGSNDLQSVDFSGCDLSNIEDLGALFQNDSQLESVDFGGLDFKNIKNTNNMFFGTNITDINLKDAKNYDKTILSAYVNAKRNSHTKTIDFSDITIPNDLTDLSGLLSNMPDLEEVDLTNVKLPEGADITNFFMNDHKLKKINFGNIDFNKVKTNDNMFYGNDSLTDMELSNTKNVNEVVLRQYVGAAKRRKAESIDFKGIKLSANMHNISGLLSNLPDLKHADLTDLDLSNVEDLGGLFQNDSQLESVDLSGLDFKNIKNTNNMFYGNDSLTKVDLTGTRGVTRPMIDAFVKASQNKGDDTIDLSNIGSLSDHLTDLSGAFSGLKGVKKIDLTNWNTRYVTKMNDMFRNSTDLEEIDGLENWDTSNVTNMSNMFASYTNPTTNDYNPKSLSSTGHLESLDLSNWKTGNVTNMNFMFGGQTYLTSLGDLRHWDTRNVTDMRGLFYDLENIPALDLSNWVTDKVTDMSYMFSKMSKIKNLDSISEWHTHNVVDMSYMFNGMTDLEGLDLSNWDPSSVGNNTTEQNYSLARMFSNDINLTKVGDLSKWADKTGNVHSTRWMFYNTPKLENVDLHGWNTGKLQIAEGMFWKSGAKQINIDNWDLINIKRITPAGYVEGKAGEGVLRGVENMFKNLTNPAVISMNNVILPDARNAFEINDFEGNKAIVVIANGKNGEALQDLLKINNQTWTDKSGNTITGRQNSDYVTYVRADDNSKQIGQHGLNFIFTNLDDLHQYFNQVTNAVNVKNDIGELSHDWDTQQDTDNNIVKITLRLSPASSYDPYRENIHAEKDSNILADLMTSKYQLHIVAPTKTTETKNPTRKIIIENPDGTTSTKEQVVEFKREVTKHIDGTEQATQWSPTKGTWGHFDVPQYDGYDSYIDGVAGTSIGAENINADTDNVTIHVTYKSNTPDNPEPDNPEPEEPRPETPEVPNTPDEPNEPEKPTVPKKNDKHKKSNKSENARPNAKDKAKNKKNSKTQNAGAHGQAAPHAATAPNRLVAPKGDQLATGKGLKELNNKPASAAKANANNKETLPQTGEEKDNVGLLGLGLLALAALGFVDRKRRD